jgi:16S rRNA (uracil1498-N3)-methyltransferase
MSRVRHRFFVQDAGMPGTTVALSADESAHATRVLRLRPGAPVGLFDGRGRELTGVIVAAAATVEVRIDDDVTPVPEPGVAVTIAHAVLKGDKMDGVVRDAVMMGAAAIRPLVTRYTEVSVAAVMRGRRVERWRRVALASAKQCGRAVLPAILEPCDLALGHGALDALDLPAPRLLLTEPAAGAAGAVPPAAIPRPAGGRATLIVGPEGGWAREEIEALEGHCTPVTVGPRTLRADAAAVVAMAALFAVWGVDHRS